MGRREKIMQEKRLYKVEQGKMLDGVCAGVAEYLNVDPTVIRLAWVVFTALGGAGILAYIVCAIIFPRKPEGY